MTQSKHRERLEEILHEYIERLNNLGFDGIDIFNDTGCFTYNQLSSIDEMGLCNRINCMHWFIDGVRCKFKKKD